MRLKLKLKSLLRFWNMFVHTFNWCNSFKTFQKMVKRERAHFCSGYQMKSFRQPFILLHSKSALQGDNVMFHVIVKQNCVVLAWVTIIINPVGENTSQKILNFVIYSLPPPPLFKTCHQVQMLRNKRTSQIAISLLVLYCAKFFANYKIESISFRQLHLPLYKLLRS